MRDAMFNVGQASRVLFSLGLIFAWGAAVNLAFSTQMDYVYMGDYEHLFFDVNKGGLYYLFHGFGLFFVLISGVFALLAKRYRNVGVGGLLGFVLIVACALAWFGYTLISSREYGVWDSLGGAGFFTWAITISVFSAADEKIGFWVFRIVELLLPVTAVIFLWAILKGDYIRVAGASMELKLYLMLWWIGAWYYLADRKRGVFWFLLRDAVVLIMLVGALYIQSRSWFVLSLIVFFIRRYSIKEVLAERERILFSLVYGVLFFLIVVVSLYFLSGVVTQALDGLLERVFEDSRSSQYVDFFESVDAWDLLVGGGPLATWYWHGFGYYQYIDNGILWLLFIGGAPLLIGYGLFVLMPGWRFVSNPFIRARCPEFSLLFLYFLMLLGFSTYMNPSVSFNSYFLYFIVGQWYFKNKHFR